MSKAIYDFGGGHYHVKISSREEAEDVIEFLHAQGWVFSDGYSSLSYNYYVACQVESKLRKKKATTAEHALFMFRAPKIR